MVLNVRVTFATTVVFDMHSYTDKKKNLNRGMNRHARRKHACDISSLRLKSKKGVRAGQKVQWFAAAELWQGQGFADVEQQSAGVQ